MAKVSEAARKRYFEKIKEYKAIIEQISQRGKSLLSTMESDENGKEYKQLILADEQLNAVSYFLLMNRVSCALLDVKNEGFLNDARKRCYRSIIYLEETVSNYVDVPFSDYEEYHTQIEAFGDEKRFKLVCKMGFTIDSIIEAFGENSKWKWSFVELQGRFATIAKNLLNLKTFIAGMDPRVEGYETRMDHLKLVRSLLQEAADGYRQKYELSTQRIDDFKIAINFLGALRRLQIILGETEQAEAIKKKIDVWRQKMETDLKSTENKKRLARMKKTEK